MSLIEDPGTISLILAWTYTFVEIHHEILSTTILLLQLIEEGLVSVTSENMFTKYCMVNCYVKAVVMLTGSPLHDNSC